MLNDFDFQGIKFRYMVVWDVSGFYCQEKYVVEGAFQTEFSAKQYYDFLQKLGTINRNYRFVIKIYDNGNISKIHP